MGNCTEKFFSLNKGSVNYQEIRSQIRKMLCYERLMSANKGLFNEVEMQQKYDEVEPFLLKLLDHLHLPFCHKYLLIFAHIDFKEDSSTLVETALRKLLKLSYKWNTRSVNNIELLELFITNSNRNCFDTLPELGIQHSPFTVFLLNKILLTGKATAMRVYQQLKIIESNDLHYCLGNLFYNTEKDIELKFLNNIGMDFLDEYLYSEQEGEAFSKAIEGRGFFAQKNFNGAIQCFIKAANLSDNRKTMCYPFICICYVLLDMTIVSEEYLYKSTVYFNSGDHESAMLYAVALAAHGEFEMAKQIFIKSLKGEGYREDCFQEYFNNSEVMEIINNLMDDDTPSLTFLSSTYY